ncbi:UNVERIFIED_CONTAM: Arabinogalactan protein 23 [Sesamum indicum]
MDMRKIAFVALIYIATFSSVMAARNHSHNSEYAPAPTPDHAANNAIAALPAVGSFIGASVFSFFVLYMQ